MPFWWWSRNRRCFRESLILIVIQWVSRMCGELLSTSDYQTACDWFLLSDESWVHLWFKIWSPQCQCFFVFLLQAYMKRQKQSFATHLKVCCAQTDVAFFTFTLRNTLVAVLRAGRGETADWLNLCASVWAAQECGKVPGKYIFPLGPEV